MINKMTQFNDSYIYFVYDIIMENDGTFRVDKYEVTLELDRKDEKLKHYYYVRTSPITSEYPEDLQTYIVMLRNIGYLSAYEFPNDEKTKGADYLSLNLAIDSKLWWEKCKNTKFLEKIYQEKEDILALYIHYINMINGKESLMCLATSKYNLKKVDAMRQEGFKSVEDSRIKDMIDNIEPIKGKVYRVNNEETKKR